ncbi:Uu.00g130740.m01.CDS01 [Anthostomella pinea]|uniref:Uu.00g130740.m01.CDS01 n=1 Tax=Anthostomella pinea TaxID=933095 RepID=A0AAI8VJP5_9PEZI|nr:Uu.00g130740.m01.CDS01 [Anthostomella pinea]
MGNKSKFTFPVPGRSSNKQQQVPALSISTPLSKAQRILGTGGINIDSPQSAKEPNRSWETSSNGGISISISESEASLSTAETGFGAVDEDETPETSYGRGIWEQESEIIPRQLQSAHGPSKPRRGLTPKRSAVTIGEDYRDGMTDDSFARRRMSTSTVWTHYESAKMPLAISQQTSNSAMAKGLPSKASRLMDMDGPVTDSEIKKKKPSRLDFSMLRSKNRKARKESCTPEVPPVLGNNYVTRSPSVVSPFGDPPLASPSYSESNSQTPRNLTKQQSPATHGIPARTSVQPRGTKDAAGLHQLYSHYEQMSFRDSPTFEEEGEEEEEEEQKEVQQPENQFLEPRTYQPSLNTFQPSLKGSARSRDFITPLPHPPSRDRNIAWGHSRDDSHDSKATATRSEAQSAPHARPTSRKDYATSVSSRHTRTSRASPSARSILSSDRQNNSVLSLSDTSSDEEDQANECVPSASLLHQSNSSRDDLSMSSGHRQCGGARPAAAHPRATNHAGDATLTQHNDYLTIPQALPKTRTGRSFSGSTSGSRNSTISTLQPRHPPVPSAQDRRRSSPRTFETTDSISPRQSGFGVQEARVVSFMPLSLTAEAASRVTVPDTPSHLDQILFRNTNNRTSNNSHGSDQPTPPLSPNSVEFCIGRPGSSLHKRPMAVTPAEAAHNARMMAVTKQEEMLLAALRKKRARMWENIIAEIKEDRSSRAGGSSSGCSGSGGSDDKILTSASPNTKVNPTGFPTRKSSLVGRGDKRNGHGHERQHDHHADGAPKVGLPPIPSHAHPETKVAHPNSTPNIGLASTSPEPPRHERVLLYLDRPLNGVDPINDTAEPSPDISEFQFFDSEYAHNNNDGRRSRTPSRMVSTYHHYNSKRGSERPRPDSSPVSPRSSPLGLAFGFPKPQSTILKEVPEFNEADEDGRGHGYRDDVDVDDDVDDMDFDDFDDVGGGIQHEHDHRPHGEQPQLPNGQDKGVARPDSPVSPGLLHPSSAKHVRSKKSTVRLSAVGQASSSMPWWGDDD